MMCIHHLSIHLSIARGSLLEVEAVLYTSIYLEFLQAKDAAPSFRLVRRVGRMLTAMPKSLAKAAT